MPKGKDGHVKRFAFMQRFDLLDLDSDGYYLRRLRIIQTPWFGIYLHRFEGPDPRPTLHDHPYNFLSLVLKGGYIERRLNTFTRQVDEQHLIKRANLMHTYDAHAITHLLRVPTWTLLLVGRRVRKWGYWEPYTTPGATNSYRDPRWVWTEFDKHYHAYESDRAWDRRQHGA